MTLLSISVGELRRLSGLDAADTSQDAALALLQDAEQEAAEYALDPAALAASAADAGLRATLTLGVAETLAGSFLGQQARAPGAEDGVKIGDLTLTPSGAAALADALAGKGTERLKPYGRAAALPTTGGGSSLDAPGDDSGPLWGVAAASALDGPCSDGAAGVCCSEDV